MKISYITLRNYMKQRRLYIEEIAFICGVSRQTVYNWRSAATIPDGYARLIQLWATSSEKQRAMCRHNIFDQRPSMARAEAIRKSAGVSRQYEESYKKSMAEQATPAQYVLFKPPADLLEKLKKTQKE